MIMKGALPQKRGDEGNAEHQKEGQQGKKGKSIEAISCRIDEMLVHGKGSLRVTEPSRQPCYQVQVRF